MKKILFTFLLIILCQSLTAKESPIILYLNNKPVGEITLFEEIPVMEAEIISSRTGLTAKYEGNKLYLNDKIFNGLKIKKGNKIFISLKDFAEMFDFSYSFDLKGKTVDIKTFQPRLQEKTSIKKEEKKETEKSGDEIQILYERTVQEKNNIFTVYATIQNSSGKILDCVNISCLFSLSGTFVDNKSVSLNTLYPGDCRKVSFSVPKPPADKGSINIFGGSVNVPGGGTYSSYGFGDANPVPQQLATPDYKISSSYTVRK